MRRPTVGMLALLCLGLALAAGQAGAADIKVLSTGNMQSILGALTADFEGATGHKLVIEYGSTPKMKTRVESGEAADLTINERYVLDDLLKQGRVEAGTLIDLARSPFGVGVRSGAPKPDISSAEAFKRALLAADSIAVPDPSGGAQDGTYFFGLIMRMGIADELKPKIKLTQGGDAAAQLVAAGGAQIGVAHGIAVHRRIIEWRQIARRLEISEHTVKFHAGAVLGKLNARSRAEAVARAIGLGWILV